MRGLIAAAALLAPCAAAAQVSNPPAPAALPADVARTSDLDAMRSQIPVPATTTPPGVTDNGTLGTMTGIYALANHTHASKARKGRVLIPASGAATFSFVGADGVTPAPFAAGVVPLCVTNAEAIKGDTNVVNSQLDGPPTNTGVSIRITRTAVTAASLLGLNILSVPTQIATWAAYVCLEP